MNSKRSWETRCSYTKLIYFIKHHKKRRKNRSFQSQMKGKSWTCIQYEDDVVSSTLKLFNRNERNRLKRLTYPRKRLIFYRIIYKLRPSYVVFSWILIFLVLWKSYHCLEKFSLQHKIISSSKKLEMKSNFEDTV